MGESRLSKITSVKWLAALSARSIFSVRELVVVAFVRVGNKPIPRRK
jgi:hypothetical protein